MGSTSLTNTAIALTGLEELFLRSTMRARFFLFRRIRGKGAYHPDALERKRQVWACQINVSAVVEVVSILAAAFVCIGFSRNAYVVNLGYDSVVPGTIEAELDQWAIIQGAVLQIAMEVVVDTLCFYLEERQGIPVVGWYFERLARSWAMIAMHLVCLLLALHWTL